MLGTFEHKKMIIVPLRSFNDNIYWYDINEKFYYFKAFGKGGDDIL